MYEYNYLLKTKGTAQENIEEIASNFKNNTVLVYN